VVVEGGWITPVSGSTVGEVEEKVGDCRWISPVTASRCEMDGTGRISGFEGGMGERIDWYMGSAGFIGVNNRRISVAEIDAPTNNILCV